MVGPVVVDCAGLVRHLFHGLFFWYLFGFSRFELRTFFPFVWTFSAKYFFPRNFGRPVILTLWILDVSKAKRTVTEFLARRTIVKREADLWDQKHEKKRNPFLTYRKVRCVIVFLIQLWIRKDISIKERGLHFSFSSTDRIRFDHRSKFSSSWCHPPCKVEMKTIVSPGERV